MIGAGLLLSGVGSAGLMTLSLPEVLHHVMHEFEDYDDYNINFCSGLYNCIIGIG